MGTRRPVITHAKHAFTHLALVGALSLTFGCNDGQPSPTPKAGEKQTAAQKAAPKAGARQAADKGAAKPEKKKASGKKRGKKVVEEKPLPPGPDLGAPDKGFDLAAGLKSLTGTWLIIPQWGRRVDVWHIEGSKGQIIRGVLEREVEALVDLTAPCRVRFTVKKPDSPAFNWQRNFAFDGDKLLAGQAPAGVHKDGRTVICARAGVFIHEGDKCAYHPDPRKPGEKPGSVLASCKLENDVFEGQAGKLKVKLTRKGGALFSKALGTLEKVPGLKVARARLAELSKPLPGESAPPIKGRAERK